MTKLGVALRNSAKAPKTATKIKRCNTESRLIAAAGGKTGSFSESSRVLGPTHCLFYGQKISCSFARYEEPAYSTNHSEAQHKILMSIQMRDRRKKTIYQPHRRAGKPQPV
jgi:hypothetical protein